MFPDKEQPKPAQPLSRIPSEDPPQTLAEQTLDQAVRFAVAYRTRVAWQDWARSLNLQQRAIFEAIREGGKTPTGESLPALENLPHELRMMLDEAYRVWDGEQKP
jgi:hypothetical protein